VKDFGHADVQMRSIWAVVGSSCLLSLSLASHLRSDLAHSFEELTRWKVRHEKLGADTVQGLHIYLSLVIKILVPSVCLRYAG
jgi:hypothetical protein